MFAQASSHGIGGDPLKWGYACTLTAGSVLPVSRKGSIYMVDGSGTINRLTPLPKGAVVDLHFNAAPTLVHSTLLLLPGSANITVDAGSVARFISLGNGVWRCAALDTTYGRQLAAAVSASAARTAIGLASVPREVLTANRTYYVRTDGSDSNTGLVDSSGGAFLTWQKAWNVILTLDLGGFTVTVQVRDGTYTGALSITKPAVGGSVIFQGNSTTPANVVLSTTSSDAIFVSGQGHYLTLKDFKVQTTTAGSAIHTDTGAVVNVGNLNFGACAGSHLSAENGSQIVYNNSVAAISGGATSFSAAYNGAQIAFRGNTVTLSGTPAFSTAFAFGMVNSSTFIDLNTFSGSATGARYLAILNAVINVSGAGASHLPGNSAGSTATGGQYG